MDVACNAQPSLSISCPLIEDFLADDQYNDGPDYQLIFGAFPSNAKCRPRIRTISTAFVYRNFYVASLKELIIHYFVGLLPFNSPYLLQCTP